MIPIVPMRYNNEIQRIADRCAKENGKFAAVYYGRTHDTLVFIPVYASSEPLCEGLPQYVLVRDGEVEYHCSLNFFEFDDALTYRHYPRKGKTMFDAYNKMYEQRIFASSKDEEKISEIIHAARGGYEQPVILADLYTYLEIANRYGMTIDFVPDPSTTDRCDGWAYFIKVKRGKLPKIINLK